MRKNRFYLLAASLLVSALIAHNVGSLHKPPLSPASASATPQATTTGQSAANLVNVQALPQRSRVDLLQIEADLEIKLRTAQQALAHEIEQAGLNANELNARYNPRAEQAFYKTLPVAVREGYVNLHSVIHELQDVTLALDGKTRDFFKQSTPTAPDRKSTRLNSSH